jgi:hypothetical protein
LKKLAKLQAAKDAKDKKKQGAQEETKGEAPAKEQKPAQ